MSDKEMIIETTEKAVAEETETKKTLGQKIKNLGQKVKGGAKKVVDSKTFRIVTGVVSTAAVGAVALIATGVIGGDSDEDVDLLPTGDDTIALDDGDFEVSDVLDSVEEVEI